MALIALNEEVIEKGERCECGGEVDILYSIQSDPEIWAGRCFQCGERLNVVCPQLTKKMLLSHWTLKPPMRQFVIDVVKGPLEVAIILAAFLIPEITHENTMLFNTHILLDKRDEFFKYEDNPTKEKLLKAVWKIFIWVYEHDPYYRYRWDWVLEVLVNSLWKPRMCGLPFGCWNEPEPYGGGYLLKDEKLYSMRRRMKILEQRYDNTITITE